MKLLVPKFNPALWSDPDIEKLNPEEKLAFIWGWTNHQINHCGFCEYSESRFTLETGLKFQTMLKVVEKMPRGVMHFSARGILYFRKFIRHQWGSGESLERNNVFKSIMHAFYGISHQELRLALASDYPEIAIHSRNNHSDSTPKPISDRMQPIMPVEFDLEEPPVSKFNRVKSLSRARAMSETEVVEFTLSIGLTAEDGEWFWSKCEGNGWKNDGKPIRDWKQTIRAWAFAGYMPSKKKPIGSNGTTGGTPDLPML